MHLSKLTLALAFFGTGRGGKGEWVVSWGVSWGACGIGGVVVVVVVVEKGWDEGKEGG